MRKKNTSSDAECIRKLERCKFVEISLARAKIHDFLSCSSKDILFFP